MKRPTQVIAREKSEAKFLCLQRKLFGAAFLAWVCAFPFIDIFVQPANAQGHPAAQSSAPRLQMRDLDPIVNELPPRFAGVALPALYRALRSHQPSLYKSEYETSEEYSRRIVHVNALELLNGIPLGGLIAILPSCIHDIALGDQECKSAYDADKAILRVESPIEKEMDSFQATVNDGPRRPGGIGQNSYGARFPISKMDIVTYSIVAKTPEWFNGQSEKAFPGEEKAFPEEYATTVSMPIEVAEARAAKENIRELVIARVVPPFYSVQESVNAASPSFPIQSHVESRSIYMEIEQVWFFNLKTGKIYRKLSAQSVPSRLNAQKDEASESVAPAAVPSSEVEVVSGEQAVYPPIARAARISGDVVLKVTISTLGTPLNLRVVSGPPMLTQSALAAVRSWRFKPYVWRGNAVEVETDVKVPFSLK
jgi:TonB family protein